MNVHAIMSSSILTVGPSTTVRDAIRLIEDSEVRHLPVVDGDRKLLGIVSDSDLREFRGVRMVERFADLDRAQTDDLLDTVISEVMATNVVSVDSNETIESAIDAILEYKLSAVPVIDRDSQELIGIISYIDILRYARDLIHAE